MVISEVSIEVGQAEITLVAGLNGSGKSTLLKSVFGLLPMQHGEVEIGKYGLVRPYPRTLYRFGVNYWPQGMRVFDDLSVTDHFALAIRSMSQKARSDRISTCFEEFPELASRRGLLASSLSGGEKQTLAMATAICSGGQVLLLDEPCLGLSPGSSWDLLQRLRRLADVARVGIVLVEHRIREAVSVADTIVALRGGVVSFSGLAKPFREADGPERVARLM